MLQPIGSHARYIQSVLRGTARDEGPGTPDYVKRSWLRCLTQYHLDPQSQREPYVLPRNERLDRKERNLELVSFADAEMAHLYHQLAGSGYSIILTDRDGVLLDYYGDLSFRNAAFRTGLVLGAVWSEEHGGTNGMGTCLFERAPLIVHRDQHFFSRNTGLTCCAAPIFDYRGDLVAVLDASGESDRAQQHTLVLVNMSAQMIENRLFLYRFKDEFVVRFHSRPELVGTWGEGIIALDAAGAIAALDRNALFQLGVKSATELTGAPLERVFNISLSALVGRSQKKSFHPLPIYDARHGGRFFAIAQAPQSKRGLGSKQRVARIEELPLPDPGRSPLDELDFGDPMMARNIQAARRTQSREVPILLLGESGTGKEFFARAMHASSDRADKPFVAVNCSSLPEPQLEQELFGRPPGSRGAQSPPPAAAPAAAATPPQGEGPAAPEKADADEDLGRIVQANGGTLFLDDVGELPLELQARLLHVIEEREVLRPDGETPVRVDVRVVSAARGGLQEKVRRSEFREDLFYRLQSLVLTLPPLRERKDKAALIRHIFAQESAATPSVSLGDDLADALRAYAWPGNIRQLRNVLRGMIAMRSGDRLDGSCLPADYGVGEQEHVPAAEDCELPPEAQSLNPLERAERGALLKEIELHHGNISRVAQKLGIGRNTLYRKMRRLGITLPARH
ncbi:MAG TPA: sigma-54-dependent Fis family transcriptional regulator [Steroidobacteraceae bacterium]|nr:sigma-54-dependent Fis family transcriptional regulator [Steroidobacteraceae bacterium]